MVPFYYAITFIYDAILDNIRFSFVVYESIVNNATGVNQASNPRFAVSAFSFISFFSFLSVIRLQLNN